MEISIVEQIRSVAREGDYRPLWSRFKLECKLFTEIL